MPRDLIEVAPSGTVTGAAGTVCLCRPEIGLWAVAADDPRSLRLVEALAALDGAVDEAQLARIARRKTGVSAAIALLRPPHLLYLRLGGGSAHRLGRAGLIPLVASPDVEPMRVRLDADDRIILGAPAIADVVDGTALLLERLPPNAAAKLLVQRAEAAGRHGSGAVVLALSDRPQASTRPMVISAPAPPRPPSRIRPVVVSAAAAVALSFTAVLGLAVFRETSEPTPQHEVAQAPSQESAPAPADEGDLAAADRRFAQTAQLAVAVAAIDRTVQQLDLPIAGDHAAAIRPFAPAALDAQARALAARLPGWPLAVPLRVPLRLSSPFGLRVHPVTGIPALHAGLDLVAPAGTPIYAAGDGRVLRAGPVGGYGNMVEIQHADGLVTRYGHMQSIAVEAGQEVTAATVIGQLGSTGVSTGPHLHYEIRRAEEPVDPMPFLQAGQALKSMLAAVVRN
ncbi:M23 family metallopeptidase [Inquilinus sp. NPDC058860]|uniref:M23 family metallopeptidase n=1 Tax=Inquilinus sp. NPDC058860 TaxID=3346652 RepID=UPI0036C05D1C